MNELLKTLYWNLYTPCKHYATGDFKKCIKCLKKSNLAAEELKYSLLFRAYYNLNNLPKALSALQQYFEVTKHKTILLVLLDDTHITFDALDEAVFDIIVQNYSDIEMMETFEADRKSKAIQNQGVENAKKIKSFYEGKLKENSAFTAKKGAAKRELLKEQLDKLRQESVSG